MKFLRIHIFHSLFIFCVFSLLASTVNGESDKNIHISNQHVEDSMSSTDIETFDAEEEFEKIIKFAPNEISSNEFYELEHKLMRGVTGSNGYFLDKDQIIWLKMCEAVFKAKGVELKGWHLRHQAFVDSYYHMGKYNEALKEARAIKDPYWIEILEWLTSNNEFRSGKLNIKEYHGPISYIGKISENARIDSDKDLYVSLFKGPVVKYDKQKKRHSIVYMPSDEQDDCRNLGIEDNLLNMKFEDKEIILDLSKTIGVRLR